MRRWSTGEQVSRKLCQWLRETLRRNTSQVLDNAFERNILPAQGRTGNCSSACFKGDELTSLVGFFLLRQGLYDLPCQKLFITGAVSGPCLALRFHTILADVVERYPDNEAIVSLPQKRRLSYRQLAQEVDQLGRCTARHWALAKVNASGIWSIPIISSGYYCNWRARVSVPFWLISTLHIEAKNWLTH